MTLKIHGRRISSPIRTRSDPQTAGPVLSTAPSPPAATEVEPKANLASRVERAGRLGHDFSRLPAPLRGLTPGGGSPDSVRPQVGGGGVIQRHGKKGKKKTSSVVTDRQKKAGLTLGRGFEQHGISVGRKGHTKGGVAASGSSRAATHAHGDEVAIKAAKQNAIQSGKVTRQQLQSSVVRSKDASEKRKEKAEQKETKRETGGRKEWGGTGRKGKKEKDRYEKWLTRS